MWFTATSFEYANNATSLAVTRRYLKAEPASEVTHCSSVAQPDFDLIMFTHFNLAVLIVVLTLHDKGKSLFIVHMWCHAWWHYKWCQNWDRARLRFWFNRIWHNPPSCSHSRSSHWRNHRWPWGRGTQQAIHGAFGDAQTRWSESPLWWLPCEWAFCGDCCPLPSWVSLTVYVYLKGIMWTDKFSYPNTKLKLLSETEIFVSWWLHKFGHKLVLKKVSFVVYCIT